MMKNYKIYLINLFIFIDCAFAIQDLPIKQIFDEALMKSVHEQENTSQHSIDSPYENISTAITDLDIEVTTESVFVTALVDNDVELESTTMTDNLFINTSRNAIKRLSKKEKIDSVDLNLLNRTNLTNLVRMSKTVPKKGVEENNVKLSSSVGKKGVPLIPHSVPKKGVNVSDTINSSGANLNLTLSNVITNSSNNLIIFNATKDKDFNSIDASDSIVNTMSSTNFQNDITVDIITEEYITTISTPTTSVKHHSKPKTSINGPVGLVYINNSKISSTLYFTIFVIMLLLIVGTLVGYKSLRDIWSRRHYSRMDFLVDGMYDL